LTNPGTDFLAAANPETAHDLICFSHLRWNFVFQRPQHLMTRFARERRVFFFEEPVFDAEQPVLDVQLDQRIHVVVPHLPTGLSPASVRVELRRLLKELLAANAIDHPLAWYYTPMALSFSRELLPSVVVFDCMDELSAFQGAPRELIELEAELMGRADLVFTGGQSLYEAKRNRHRRIFPFPSSVDVAHFSKARTPQADPSDLAGIPHPRLGFFGVIDERMDLDLLAAAAAQRPEWHFVLLGPVVKIDPAVLPRLPNIHYLGMKLYAQLPAYLAGWDVALLPFAKNDATRFISPTKTPEYLAAGRPVVSTSVRDVVRPYGEQQLVKIADTPDAFVAAIEQSLSPQTDGWRRAVDAFLSEMSWDHTWMAMRRLIDEAARARASAADLSLRTPLVAGRADSAAARF
jgi:UDP-galactopyranose mutase